jgi:iron complex outermembrane receptor protein
MFRKSKLCTAALVALGGAVAFTALPSFAQTTQSVEVTGSRIKRAAAEGSLPIISVSREELEASGQATVAEFIRSVPVFTGGNFRPQSGSSAQAFSEANLRGLGGRRTLVLLDGRRIAKSPIVGDSVDMNSIPMAAVERIEILTDGASAVYGSDAIGGVINVILRKDFNGLAMMYGETKPDVKGGDRTEASAMLGFTTDKARLLLGASKTTRGIIFVRDYPWGAAVGASTYNYARDPGFGSGGSVIRAVPGANACSGPGFYTTNRCRYNFNLVAADEAALDTSALFARGDLKISDDWSAYMSTSLSRVGSFGRYAPVPGDIKIEPGSPAHPWHSAYPDLSYRAVPGTIPDPVTGIIPARVPANGILANETVFVAHRFAAGGNRDTTTTTNLADVQLGFTGRLFGADVEIGTRKSDSKYVEVGRGYVIETLARLAISEGRYSVFNPFGASAATLQSFTATVGRDASFNSTEIFANATVELFKLSGGAAQLFFGVEQRKEFYEDIYDSLSESGVVLGSAGNSAGGKRTVSAASAELVMPIFKGFEATLAARYEKYSDYGDDFSPKVSMRYQPTKNITLRASAGKGFSAPTLPQLTAKPASSADDAVDLRHCLADGGFTALECADDKPPFQINGLVISNPALTSEKSTQFSLGGAWDVTSDITLKLDYWNTEIDGVISNVSAQDIIDRDNGDDPRAVPAGLSIKRDPVTGAIQQIVRGSTNEGLLKKSGIDFGVSVGYSLGGFGKLRHDFAWSHVLTDTLDGADTNGFFGAPKDRATLGTKWSMGPVDATWNINVIGKNGDDTIGNVKQYVTHDVQIGYNTPIKGARIMVGAINAGGKQPELVSDGSKPFNYNLYDAYGMQAYFRVQMKF